MRRRAKDLHFGLSKLHQLKNAYQTTISYALIFQVLIWSKCDTPKLSVLRLICVDAVLGRGLQVLHDQNVIVKNVSLVQHLTAVYRASS